MPTRADKVQQRMNERQVKKSKGRLDELSSSGGPLILHSN